MIPTLETTIYVIAAILATPFLAGVCWLLYRIVRVIIEDIKAKKEKRNER